MGVGWYKQVFVVVELGIPQLVELGIPPLAVLDIPPKKKETDGQGFFCPKELQGVSIP